MHCPVSLSPSGPDLNLPAFTCLLHDLQLGVVVSFVCLSSLGSGFRWFLLSLYISYHIYFSIIHLLSFGLIPVGSVSRSVIGRCWSAVNVDRVLLMSVRPRSMVSLSHKDICCVHALFGVSGHQVPLSVLWAMKYIQALLKPQNTVISHAPPLESEFLSGVFLHVCWGPWAPCLNLTVFFDN